MKAQTQRRTRVRNRTNPVYTWQKPRDKNREADIMVPSHIMAHRKLEAIAAGPRFGFLGAIASTKGVLYLFNRKGILFNQLKGVKLETAKKHFRRYYDTHSFA